MHGEPGFGQRVVASAQRLAVKGDVLEGQLFAVEHQCLLRHTLGMALDLQACLDSGRRWVQLEAQFDVGDTVGGGR